MNTIAPPLDYGLQEKVKSLSKWSVFWLWANILVSGFKILENGSILGWIIASGNFGVTQRIDSMPWGLFAVLQWLLVLAELVCLLLTAICFLRWVNVVNKYVRALGAQGLAYTPGWAVGWWFIPFANLTHPRLVVHELWKASSTPGPTPGTAAAPFINPMPVAAPPIASPAPELTANIPPPLPPQLSAGDTSWKNTPPTPWIDVWWICFILSNIVSNIDSRLSVSTNENVYDAPSFLSFIEAILSIVAAYYLIKIVQGVLAKLTGRGVQQGQGTNPLGANW